MMTLSKVTNAKAAASYYGEVDDYYVNGQAPTEWIGSGASALGLSREVEKEQFTKVLAGELPDGSRLLVGGDGTRRAASDFTFSAPKSVSLQALVGGDVALIEAHERAVRSSMRYVESELAAYRVRDREAGTLTLHKSGNLVAASIRHDVSRAADPQLHTHVVVINATQTASGTWRALDHTEILKQQKLIGAYYRNELAHEVQRLGYALRVEHGDGRFELAHISREQIASFSKRSEAIEKALAEQSWHRGEVSARHKEVIALATRDKKMSLDREATRLDWQQQSTALNINFTPALVSRTHDTAVRTQASEKALEYSVGHHIERQSVIDERKLFQVALEYGVGRVDFATIRQAKDDRVKDGTLLQENKRFTTREAQQREREIIGIEQRGRSAVRSILNDNQAKASLRRFQLNAGQKVAARMMLTTSNRVVGIQGVAGAGKTALLKAVNSIAATTKFSVVGIAPSTAAVGALEDAGIPSKTVAAFNARTVSALDSRTVVVIDEAGMVGAVDMQRLLQRIEDTGARAILVGDIKQLKSIAAGQPFGQLQRSGMETAKMTEILRQREEMLKEAVALAADGLIHESIARLQAQVVEVDHARERRIAIARAYATLTEKEQLSTLVVAGTRIARRAINSEIRAIRGLADKGIHVQTLDAKDMTEAQRSSYRSYQVGDFLQSERAYPSLTMQKNDMAKVVQIEKSGIIVELQDGARKAWNPRVQPGLTAHLASEIELEIGDRIRFTKNEHSLRVINGERGTVASIDAAENTISIRKDDGEYVTLSTLRPLHIDHGYACTVHAAQGLTCDRILIDADTASVTANEALYYVAISRARYQATIFTDDRDLLPEVMSREDVKTVALDIDDTRHMAGTNEYEADQCER